jgi:hypothetical protein
VTELSAETDASQLRAEKRALLADLVSLRHYYASGALPRSEFELEKLAVEARLDAIYSRLVET